MYCIIILPRSLLQSHDFSWTLNPNIPPVYLSLFLVSLFHQTYSEELIVLQGGLSLTDRFRFSRFKTRIEWLRLTQSVCLNYLHFPCVRRDGRASLPVNIGTSVSHTSTVHQCFPFWHCPAVTWRIWMYILLLFYKDVNRKRSRCCVAVSFSSVSFCLFYLLQEQRCCLSLFLLSASPPGLSILSQLFLVHEAIPGLPYHIPTPLLTRWCWAEVSPRCCCSPDLGALKEGRYDPDMSASHLAFLQIGLELQLSSAVTALWTWCQAGLQ